VSRALTTTALPPVLDYTNSVDAFADTVAQLLGARCVEILTGPDRVALVMDPGGLDHTEFYRAYAELMRRPGRVVFQLTHIWPTHEMVTATLRPVQEMTP